jgi:hypothetical protein
MRGALRRCRFTSKGDARLSNSGNSPSLDGNRTARQDPAARITKINSPSCSPLHLQMAKALVNGFPNTTERKFVIDVITQRAFTSSPSSPVSSCFSQTPRDR